MSKAVMARNKARAYQVGAQQAERLFNTNEYRRHINSGIVHARNHLVLLPEVPYLEGMKDWFAEQVQAGFNFRLEELKALAQGSGAVKCEQLG